MKAVAEGKQGAFRELYQLFSDKVYNTAISYSRNEQDAEEITQDVFASIFKNATKFKGDSEVGTWIYRITINASLNFIKKRNRLSFLNFENKTIEKPDFEHPGALIEKKEHSAFLLSAIETLPKNQKTAFILSFIEDLPRQEVADIMETSLKAVESLLQRAKANLRNQLEKLYPYRRKNN